MTRVSAANGDAYPVGRLEVLSGETAFRFAEAGARGPSEALRLGMDRSPVLCSLIWRAFVKNRSPFLWPRSGRALGPRLVPGGGFRVVIGAAIAIFAVLTLTLQHLRLERDLALSAGAREVDMRATLLAHRLNAALSADPQASEAEVFRTFLRLIPTSGSRNRSSSTVTAASSDTRGPEDASDLALAALARRDKTVRSQRHRGRGDPHRRPNTAAINLPLCGCCRGR